jgi:nucleotide-binding universal stress UspA family protein
VGLQASALVASGVACSETLAAAEKLKVDLIVIEARRSEVKDFLTGPDAARIARHADCSVLVGRS